MRNDVHVMPRAGEWVVVHGCGGVGLSAVMIERGYHSLFFPGGTRSRSGMRL